MAIPENKKARKQVYTHIIFFRWTPKKKKKCISKIVWALQLIFVRI